MNDLTTAPQWNLDRIPFDQIDLALVREREDLFYLVTAASFVEIAADLYTDNLIRYFNGDDDVVDWLEHHWKPEEVRHGKALRAYVCHVWPEFDWDRAYSAFFAQYAPLCTVDAFERTRSLEMVARCVVETGTATFYQALADQTEEPVLAGIASRIRSDEISHYKHFYRYFCTYSASEQPGRWRVLAALRRRIVEARNDDADCALWHAFAVRQPADSADKAAFKALSTSLARQIRRHYPLDMATKMLLKPLHLPAVLAHALQGPVARTMAKLLI